jgi:carboxylesterase
MRVGFEVKGGKVGVLLIHGLTGTPDEVKPISEYLAPKGYSTLGPWLEGHGTSPRDLARTRWEDWASSARSAFESLKSRCEKVFVCGLSMGGDLALYLSARLPVAGLITLATPVKIHDFRFNAVGFFRFLQWRTSNLTGGVLDPSAPPHLTYPYVATQNLFELKKLMDLVREELTSIKVPALVVQGRKDSMVPPDNGERIFRGLGSPSKHLLYLDRSDHVVTLDYDHPMVFEKIEKFLSSEGNTID